MKTDESKAFGETRPKTGTCWGGAKTTGTGIEYVVGPEEFHGPEWFRTAPVQHPHSGRAGGRGVAMSFLDSARRWWQQRTGEEETPLDGYTPA